MAVSLNRAEKHNAMTGELIAELSDKADRLAADPGVRAVVLKGEGRSFCAGADLDWMKIQFTSPDSERRREALALARMLQKWHRLPKPVIGRIHGNVFGGGVGLMAVCDAAVADRAAVFALSETRLGLIPATISPYVIAKTGAARARQLFMSGRRFDAASAADFGLADQVADSGDLDAAVQAEAESYLRGAPGAIAAAKSLTHALGPAIDDEVISWTAEQLLRRWSGSEAQEGVAAFFERRRPVWPGSGSEPRR